MSIKKIVKKTLIKVANSSQGPRVQEALRQALGVVDNEAGRNFRNEMAKKLAVNELIDANIGMQKKSVVFNDRGQTDKIKIRFFHCNANTFNVIQTVCKAFQNDERFDVLVVLFGGSYSAMIAQMEDMGINYVTETDYDIAVDKPDISVAYHLEIIYPPKLQKIKDFSRLFVLIPLSIGSIWFGDRTVNRMNLEQFNADMCFVGNLCYDRLVEPVGKSVIERMSPPQFDLLYKKMSENVVYPMGWEKLKGKKTVMLMTDHGLRKNGVSDEVSFDLYIKSIISYVKEHRDVGLILRLHFALINELLGTYWTVSDYEKFRKFCEDSPNIIWDTTDDYLVGLSIADASLIDVNCSLIYYALGARKPIGIPLRYDMPVKVNNPELLECYYQIKSTEDCNRFFDMIRNGSDPMKETREEAFEKYITTMDGLNGERIYKKIVERYRQINQ